MNPQSAPSTATAANRTNPPPPMDPYPSAPVPGTVPPGYPAAPDAYYGPMPAASPGIALHLRPEQQIPDHPGSVVGVAPPRPPRTLSPRPLVPTARDVEALKTNCQFALREYVSLVRSRQRVDASTAALDLEARIRAQAGLVSAELRTLQAEVRDLAKMAENHRWRKWLLGGAIASFIPIVRRLWRRGTDQESKHSSNDTEYAFRRSKSLLSRINDSVFGRGGLASVGFFVFAVLYVFQAEVSLRVARTMQKRIKKLCSKIERGDTSQQEKMKRKAQEVDASEASSSSAPSRIPRAVGMSEAAKDRYYRELYAKPPDFKDLARKDPAFAAITKGREVDFNDPRSVMQLTKTLLKLDFGLHIELPSDRLCPPVPNRHNYILWLKQLLDSTSYEQPRRRVVGLDIGTGASCIYPLLGCTQRPWSFIATDVDAHNLEWASKNVSSNGLQPRIKVVPRQPQDALIPIDDLSIESIDFTMTNPPFYRSEEEMVHSAKQKSRPPYTACTGAEVEMVVEGGEMGFALRILNESLLLRDRVQWYTIMFGFLSSVTQLVEELRQHGLHNYAVTELVQGTKTRRWAVGWSFQAMRPEQDVARGMKTAIAQNILPPVTQYEALRKPMPDTIGRLAEHVSEAVGSLDLVTWIWDRERLEGTGRAVDKVWARAWRRKKKREMEVTGQSAGEVLQDPKDVFGFRCWVHVAKNEVVVGCRWLEGHDATTFESFQGFLKTTAQTAYDKCQ
ncbi:hypothetical protein S40288_05474 [Stachybotrys chartarum IBT 40288]|nr:hypothetical protein S40288_05474 [Stachybotrys chartarum IBT 40288]